MSLITKYNGKLNVTGKLLKKYREKEKISYEQLSARLELMGISIHKQSIRIYRRIRQTRRTVGHESELLCIRCMRWHYNVLYYNGFPDSYPFWAGVWRRYLICWKSTSGFRPYNAEYVSLHFVVHSLQYLKLFNITCNKDIEEEHIYDIL